MSATRLEQEISHLRNPGRIINLTDGVFAIIMTLLVLELKIPEVSADKLETEFFQLGYKLFLYGISFMLAGVYWMGHRLIFSHVRYVNNKLLWMNVIFLMICSLIPFGAGLLGTYPHELCSLIAYGILLTMLAGWRLFMYFYVTSKHELLVEVVQKKQRNNVLVIMIFAPTMFLLSLCIVPFFPTVTLIIYAITPLIFTALITIANHPKKITE